MKRIQREMEYAQHHQAEKPELANKLIDQQTLKILLTVGDSQYVTEPVCYPFCAQQQPYNEAEGFQWFE